MRQLQLRMFGRILRQRRKMSLTGGVISRSMSMGMAVGFSPTVGLQFVLCFIIAQISNRLWKDNAFNTVIALIGSLVVNPATMVPTYTLYYFIGCGMMTCNGNVEFQDAGDITDLLLNLGEGTVAIFLGSLPFMILGVPVGYWLGRLVERFLEARAHRRRLKLLERARQRRAEEVRAEEVRAAQSAE